MRRLLAGWRSAPLPARRGGVGITALLLLGFFALQVLTPARASTGPHASAARATLRPAPDFTVPVWNVSGMSSFHLAALHGETVVVNFWAPWCDPCHQEAPALAAVSHAYAGKSIAFVGVAYDTNQSDVLSFLKTYGITYPCGPDNGTSIASAYRVSGLPITVVINRQGLIAHTFIGAINKASLEAVLQQQGA